MVPFVQRKKNQHLQWAARPSSLNSLPFFGHAKLGDIHTVYFDATTMNRVPNPNVPGIPGPTNFDFEISTLTLVKDFRHISYPLDGDCLYVSGMLQESTKTTSEIVFPLLVNILPTGRDHPFEPNCWHTCDDKSTALVKAGKFGCPRLVFGFNDELIILKYEGEISLTRYYDPVLEKYIEPVSIPYTDPYLIAMILPNQNLVYHILEDIELTLQNWHAIIKEYLDKQDNNLFASANSPIMFDDELQMFFCETVIIEPSAKP